MDLSEAGLMHVTAVSGLHCGFLIAQRTTEGVHPTMTM